MRICTKPWRCHQSFGEREQQQGAGASSSKEGRYTPSVASASHSRAEWSGMGGFLG